MEKAKVVKRKKGSACFKCQEIKEFDTKVPGKNTTSPSAICPECWDKIVKFGTILWHEQMKLDFGHPNYDPFNNKELVKKWNNEHPAKFELINYKEIVLSCL